MTECKVDLLVDKYDIAAPASVYDDVDDYLLARWLGGGDRTPDGYGTLTEWFNKRLMKRIYEKHGRETMGVRLDSEYDALTGDDDVVRGEVRDDIATDGIDPGRLQEAFVSRSTMRRHLTECLDGTKETNTGTSNWEKESIDLATAQARRRITKALQSLASKNEFPDLDSVDVEVTVHVSCTDDPYQVPIGEALESNFDCQGGTHEL
ncbi:MAG: hypothetical protein ACI9YT_001551 [Halobacteriales archaeon]|jgi:hypothetical protein